MTLTAEQKAILEQKRLAALKLREQKMRERGQAPVNQPSMNRPTVQPQANYVNRTHSSASVQQQISSSSISRSNQTTPANQSLYVRNNPTAAQSTYQPNRNSNYTFNAPSSTNIPRINNPTITPNSQLNATRPNQQTATPSIRPPATNSSITNNYANNTSFNNRSNNQPSSATTLNSNNNYHNRINQQQQPLRPNNSSTGGVMTQIRPYDKFQQQQNSSFVTPAKRPSDQPSSIEKRQNTAKSPYEQLMEKMTEFEINIQLASNREFYLDFKFNSRLIDIIKKFPTARYDAKNKRWLFKLENYKEIIESVKKIQIERLKLKIGPGIPENVLAILKDTLKYDEMKVDLTPKIQPAIIEKLFPYQREGIKFGVRREGRCLLADDCGLGKTMQAIGIALYYFDDWPLLIVCPASVKFQWTEALLKWVPGLSTNDIREIDSKKFDPNDSLKTNLVVITSYDSVHKCEPYIKEPKCAILDESHMVKDSKTKRFNLISKLINKAKRLVLISGTPAMSRPVELFTQLKLLMPKVFSNKDKYINRYCAPKMTRWGKVADGCSNLDELRIILQSTVMVRRMKDDVLSELPAKRRVKINLDCHLTGKDKSEMEKFVSRFKGPQQINDENESFGQAFTKTAELKLNPIKNYLEIVIEKGLKFLFFAHHRSMVDGVCDFLCEKKITFIRIDGSTPSAERSKCCDLFQKSENCKAAVLSITAAGVGLNLTAAQLVMFGELYFNPGSLIQAEDRVHRIGQKDSVYIEYLIAPGTVDDHIWNMVYRKVETLDCLGIKNDGFEFKKDNSQQDDKK